MIKTYFYSHLEKKMYHDVNLQEKNSFLKHEEDVLWVDLFNFSDREIKEVARIFDFHPLAVEDCLSFSPRAKLDNYEDYYLFAMHAIRYDEGSEEEVELVQLNVFLGQNFVVTLHKQPLQALGRLAKTSLKNPEFLNKGMEFFLYAIIDGNTDDIFPIMDRIGIRIDELEDEIYGQPSREITEEYLALKRTTLTIRRAVIPQRRIFASINAGGHPYFDISENIKPYFLDLVDHLERITDTLEGYRDLVDASLSTYHSLISTRTNDAIRVLTVISTIFMPLTFLTGFFGMNVPLPFQEMNISTILILVILGITTSLMLLLFKRLKWI